MNTPAERCLDERGDLLELLAGRSHLIPRLEWLTGSAADLVRIAVCLAGFDARVLVGRLARIPSKGERLNARTVERVLEEIRHDEGIALVVWYLAANWPTCADCGELLSTENPYSTCPTCTHDRLKPDPIMR